MHVTSLFRRELWDAGRRLRPELRRDGGGLGLLDRRRRARLARPLRARGAGVLPPRPAQPRARRAPARGRAPAHADAGHQASRAVRAPSGGRARRPVRRADADQLHAGAHLPAPRRRARARGCAIASARRARVSASGCPSACLASPAAIAALLVAGAAAGVGRVARGHGAGLARGRPRGASSLRRLLASASIRGRASRSGSRVIALLAAVAGRAAGVPRAGDLRRGRSRSSPSSGWSVWARSSIELRAARDCPNVLLDLDRHAARGSARRLRLHARPPARRSTGAWPAEGVCSRRVMSAVAEDDAVAHDDADLALSRACTAIELWEGRPAGPVLNPARRTRWPRSCATPAMPRRRSPPARTCTARAASARASSAIATRTSSGARANGCAPRPAARSSSSSTPTRCTIRTSPPPDLVARFDRRVRRRPDHRGRARASVTGGLGRLGARAPGSSGTPSTAPTRATSATCPTSTTRAFATWTTSR